MLAQCASQAYDELRRKYISLRHRYDHVLAENVGHAGNLAAQQTSIKDNQESLKDLEAEVETLQERRVQEEKIMKGESLKWAEAFMSERLRGWEEKQASEKQLKAVEESEKASKYLADLH